MTKPRYLVIMAGGASSRMKKSLANVNLSKETKSIAKHSHKSLIPLGEQNRPLLYYHFRRAPEALVGLNYKVRNAILDYFTKVDLLEATLDDRVIVKK